MPSYFPLLILFTLALLACPAPGDFGYPPTTDTYTWYDEPPTPPNPYRLVLPDMIAEFLDFVWVSTYEMYIKRGFSSTFSEIQAWSEWDECNFLFVCDNPTHTLSIKMEAAIKKAGKPK